MGDVASRTTLSFRLTGGAGWYTAVCPELDISGSGESPEKARQCLFESARLTARHILTLNGTGIPPETAYARLIQEYWDHLERIFQER